VAGEEGFVDRNGDGQFNPDEPFIDIGEPFVDANDDGIWEPPEPFQDLNEDGVWTGPNGVWDADTVLWTQTRIVYTGQPAFLQSGGQELYSRLYDQGQPPFATPPAAPFNGNRVYGVYFADENFNPLSALAKYDAGTYFGNASAKVPLAPEPGGAEPLGAFFRLLYCDQNDANCAYGPAPSACTSNVCHVVPELLGFGYGTYFDLVVKCSQAGPDTAFVTATVNGVLSSLSVNGVCP
jgi:hypothetical protein